MDNKLSATASASWNGNFSTDHTAWFQRTISWWLH